MQNADIRPGLIRIVLTGFMGSGKTTVGRVIAGRLGWSFADLDRQVEAREGRSVPQLFAERGEAFFRAAEAEVLADLLRSDPLVLALGGGAPGNAQVRNLLARSTGTAVVHLDAPFALLYDRCAAQALDPGATPRPLLGERNAAEQRYCERRTIYIAVAHYRANAALPTPAAVAADVLDRLKLPPDSAA